MLERNSKRIAPGRSFSNDYIDHYYSRHRLLVSDCGRIAAEWQERRLGCSIRRAGEPDSIWPARRGFGSFTSDDLVGDHFYADVDHAFDFRGAANWTDIRVFRSEAGADEIANHANSVYTADRATKPGANAEITCHWSDGRLARPSLSLPSEDARLSIAVGHLSLPASLPRSPHQEWILFSLHSNRCSLTMPRNDYGLIRQRHDAVVQRTHDFFVGASGKIGASDAPGKKCVASDQ